MAPNSRLEEKLKKLGLSTDDHGAQSTSPVVKSKHIFRIYFPMPPYDGLQFQALRSGPGFNFTGQLLGVGGKQLQRIKQESSARVEVVNAAGNLNGAHPDPLDPDLHALITADSLAKLQKATDMVCELLEPVNARFVSVKAVPGGSVRLVVATAKKASSAAANTGGSCQVTASQNESSSNAPVMCWAAPEAVRSASVSPMLTPVTPAATAKQSRPFPADDAVHSNTPSPVCGQSQHEARDATSQHSDLETCDRQSCSVSVPSDIRTEEDANSAAGIASVNHGYSECLRAGNRCRAMTSHDSQRLGQVDTAACYLQPSTPTARPGTQTVSNTAVQQCSRCNGRCTCCCIPLPGSHPEMAAQQTHSPIGQNNDMLPPAGSCSTNGQPAEAPTVAHVSEQKPGGGSAGLGHCFHYGLGLCSTSSWDSPLSCSSRDSPALRALLADHQRQQQEEHMQRMQAYAGVGTQFSMCTTPNQASSFAVGSLPTDDFSLGPAALPGPAAAAGQARQPLAEPHIDNLPAGFIDSTPVDAVHPDHYRIGRSVYCEQQAADATVHLKCWPGSNAEAYSSQMFYGWSQPDGFSTANPSVHSCMTGIWARSAEHGVGNQACMDYVMQGASAASPVLVGFSGFDAAACSQHTEAQQEQFTIRQEQKQQQEMLWPRSEQVGKIGSMNKCSRPAALHAVFGSIW